MGDGIGDQGRHVHRVRCGRRGNDGRGRLPPRAHVRHHVPGTGHPERGQQPVGDLVVPGHRRRVRGRRSPQRAIGYGIPALRVDGNDYLAVVGGHAMGRRAGAAQPRTDADRVGHLPRRAPTRPPTTRPVPAGRRVEGVAARRSDRAAEAAPDRPSASGPTSSTPRCERGRRRPRSRPRRKEAESYGTLLDGTARRCRERSSRTCSPRCPTTCGNSCSRCATARRHEAR